MRTLNFLLLIALVFSFELCHAQQDMDLHITGKYLAGKNILKVRRNFYDPYLWILAQNNEVYRMNSITRVWEDYTLNFSGYNNFQFLDIAGVSKDQVLIITNSSNVIEYKSGVVKTIGATDGIKGTLNGIGINNLPAANDFFFPEPEMALFSTDQGLFKYNYNTGALLPAPVVERPAMVFESSYRSMVFQGTYFCRCYEDPDIEKRDLVTSTNMTYYGGDIYLGEDFGTSIKSAYSTPWNAYIGFTWGQGLANQFWATEKGLFQNFFDWSSQTEHGYKQYLKGKVINKVAGIYGLVNFGDPNGPGNEIVKENLLVGTSKGLYYSNSQHFMLSGAKYTFFHFDELGQKTVNDINVNSNSHNYDQTNTWNNYANICEDGVWVACNDGLYFLTRDYAPYIDPDYKLTAINVDGYPFYSKEIEVCENVSVRARIDFVQYQNLAFTWYKNGELLPAETKNSLDINSGGDYHAIVLDPCSNISLNTHHLKVTVISTPTITFNYPDKIEQCLGTAATLQLNNNSNYNYRWYRNGTLYGNNTYLLTTTQPGKYKAEVSSCSGTWVATKEVEVNFISTPQPTLSANKNAYCVGDIATLTTGFINDGTYTINWFRDGNLLSAEQNKTSIATTLPGSYTVKVNSNLVACDNTSAVVPVAFESIPTIHLERIITTTLCDGQTIDIKATYSGGTIKWNTGATSDKISLNQSGTYTATIKTAAGCEVSENINVQFFNNPTLNLSDVTLCQFINEHITLSAPAGFARYEWNGQVGEASFSTNRLGTISLKVTDINGCTATQIINVASRCDEIHVPNTFTPNDDGYNDTWKIEGLEGDPSITVRVFSRTGEMVFRSVGYATPWDAAYKGKKLSAGTYYYIINAKKGEQTLSGTVTIIK